MQILSATHLTDEHIAQVRHLEMQCKHHDGIKRPLFLENIMNHQADLPGYFLCIRDGALIGVLCIFAPTPTEAEISALVLPSFRRQGIFKHLLAAACQGMHSFGIDTLLFVHEQCASDAKVILSAWPLVYDHSEYMMEFSPGNTRKPIPSDGTIILRPVVRNDLCQISSLSDLTFGASASAYAMAHICFHDENVLCFCAEQNGDIVGVCSARLEGDILSIFGLGVMPQYQGKGCGRTLLYYVIAQSKAYHKEITLEVDSTNERAFSLYTSSGFSTRTQYDYYRCKLQELVPLLNALE